MAIVFAALLVLAVSACGPKSEEPSQTVVTLSQTSISVGVGESFTLKAEASDGSQIHWNSQSEKIATVSNGVVTGVSAGETVVNAVAGNSYASCRVTVQASTEEVELFLPLTSARLKIGEQLTLEPVAPQGTEILWVSSSSAVATVSNGVVKGVSAGVARITAVAGATVQECIVTVSEAETVTLAISKNAASVKEGEGLALEAIASDGGAATWLSADSSIATVSGGIVKGVSVGKVVIHALTANASAACIVTVRDVSDTYKDGYSLVWNDEFSGSSLDLTKWGYMTGIQDVYGNSRGPVFWGNNELQYYTENAASVKDGSLVITATRQDMDNGRTYSSARLHTRDKGHWTYGYFEARMQTPAQTGLWPAFWMLPQPSSPESTGNQYGSWAASGEIDIMEARGRLGNWVDTTLHYASKDDSGNTVHVMKSGTTVMSGSTEEWHIYALEWCEDHMSWFIDGIEVYRVKSSDWSVLFAPNRATAPFDVDFYILINLAVGGTYDQNHAPGDDFVSAEMRVDYVRVYEAKA